MKRNLVLSVLFAAILVLAVGGWTVRGMRWALTA
jgi:hypothetical protein